METWRPATESAASLLHWGKIRQGENFVFSTYKYIQYLYIYIERERCQADLGIKYTSN